MTNMLQKSLVFYYPIHTLIYSVGGELFNKRQFIEIIFVFVKDFKLYTV